MSLTIEELENLSDLLWSEHDENTELAFEILEGQSTFPQELVTEVFVVYKLTDNEVLKDRALNFLRTSDLSPDIITSKIPLNRYECPSQKKLSENIQAYVEMSKGQLDGIKMGLTMFNKYRYGFNYLLTKSPDDLKKSTLRSLIEGTSIKLSNCELSEIPSLLYEFTNLTKLDLSSNNIKKIPAKVKAFKNLEVLNLSDNNLVELDDELTELTNLTKLDLSSNNIKKIPAKVKAFKNLEILNLSDNNLVELDSAFAELTKLKELNISNNSFRKFPDVLSKMENLEVLIIFNLNILSIGESFSVPTDFSKLSKLKELNLLASDIGISTFCGHFTNFPSFFRVTHKTGLNLEPLALAEYAYKQNGYIHGVSYLFEHSQDTELIHQIIREQFYDEKNEKMDLSLTMFTHLPKELIDYSVKHLDIFECYFGVPFYSASENLNEDTVVQSEKELNKRLDIFKDYKNLQTANFSGNHFRHVPKVIAEWKELKKLSLEGNRLEDLSIELTSLEKLEELVLDGNRFTQLPNSILQLKNLKKLSLAHNNLEDIPEELGKLESLEELNLLNACQERKENPHLFTIPDSFKKLKNLKVFKFYENKMEYQLNPLTNREIKNTYLKQLKAILPSDCEIKLEY